MGDSIVHHKKHLGFENVLGSKCVARVRPHGKPLKNMPKGAHHAPVCQAIMIWTPHHARNVCCDPKPVGASGVPVTSRSVTPCFAVFCSALCFFLKHGIRQERVLRFPRKTEMCGAAQMVAGRGYDGRGSSHQASAILLVRLRPPPCLKPPLLDREEKKVGAFISRSAMASCRQDEIARIDFFSERKLRNGEMPSSFLRTDQNTSLRTPLGGDGRRRIDMTDHGRRSRKVVQPTDPLPQQQQQQQQRCDTAGREA